MTKIQTQAVVNEMAVILSSYCNYSVQQLVNNHNLLDQMLQKYRKFFPWEQLAIATHLSKQQVYRWYFDNFQRHLFGNIDKSDMDIIRNEVQKLLQDCSSITKEMQMVIKQKLSKQYHRNSFTIAFNNAKNTLKKVFGFKTTTEIEPQLILPSIPNIPAVSSFYNQSTLIGTFDVLETHEEPEFMWSLNQDWEF